MENALGKYLDFFASRVVLSTYILRAPQECLEESDGRSDSTFSANDLLNG